MNIDVVIVTYNRLEKLKKTLSCYENQTAKFRNLIIVNNHSTDGTFEYLEDWKQKDASFCKHIIHTEENLGGSGGYYLGQEKAVLLKSDWIFLSDDDAYPALDMMERFYEFAETHNAKQYSAICGTVYHPDNSIDLLHRSSYEIKNHRFYKRIPSTEQDYELEMFDIDFLSYVGAFINGKALQMVGLVNPDLFIYHDDTEHSLRLKKYGRLVCVPSIHIVHDDLSVGQPAGNNTLVSWRDYYSERNETLMLKKHFPLVAIHQLKIMFRNKRKGLLTSAYDKVRIQAVKDAWCNRLGKHPIYQPGWSIKKDQDTLEQKS